MFQYKNSRLSRPVNYWIFFSDFDTSKIIPQQFWPFWVYEGAATAGTDIQFFLCSLVVRKKKKKDEPWPLEQVICMEFLNFHYGTVPLSVTKVLRGVQISKYLKFPFEMLKLMKNTIGNNKQIQIPSDLYWMNSNCFLIIIVLHTEAL